MVSEPPETQRGLKGKDQDLDELEEIKQIEFEI